MRSASSVASDPDAHERFLRFVASLTNYEEKRLVAPPRFTLDRMRALCRALGSPERAFASLHLAGSKGKGTTATLAAALLEEAGLRTGLYTSPHLIELGERIAIDGRAATTADLGDAFARVEAALADGPGLPLAPAFEGLTFFELTTAMAFVRFAGQGVRAAALEVGLGGRLDSTNVVEPAVTAITSIGLEHTRILGSTLGAIAFEKAGILKPAVPCVVGALPEEARAVVLERATDLGVPLVELRPADPAAAIGARVRAVERGGTRFDLRVPGRALGDVRLALAGLPMAENAALAVAAVDLLCEREGLGRLTDDGVRAALARTRVPGRFQVIEGGGAGGGEGGASSVGAGAAGGGRNGALVLDVAHTRESAAALARTFAEAFPGQQAALVLGVLEDKDLDGILQGLAPIASALVAAPCGSPRERDPAEVAERARAAGIPAEPAPSAAEAVERARRAAGPAGVVLVTGSFYLVGEVLRLR